MNFGMSVAADRPGLGLGADPGGSRAAWRSSGSVELLGAPRREGAARRYTAAGPLGHAILFAMMTAGPLARRWSGYRTFRTWPGPLAPQIWPVWKLPQSIWCPQPSPAGLALDVLAGAVQVAITWQPHHLGDQETRAPASTVNPAGRGNAADRR